MDIIAIKALILYHRYNKESRLHGSHDPERIAREEDQVFFESILSQDHKIFYPLVLILKEDILPLMDQELKIYLYGGQLLDSIEGALVLTFTMLVDVFFDRLV